MIDSTHYITCEICGNRYKHIDWNHTWKLHGITHREYRERFPDSKTICLKSSRRKGITERNLINKHGEEEGRRRWKSYREKQAKSNTFEYKKEKYGWTREQFDEYNQSRSTTRENFIRRHGKDKGLKKWEEYRQRQHHTCSEEYFIERYGPKRGRKKYRKWRDKADKNFSKKYADGFYPRGVSKIANDFCWRLYSEIKDRFKKIYFGDLNREFGIWLKPGRYGFVDFMIKDIDTAFEFFGDYYHANPEVYGGDEIIPYPNKIYKMAKEIREEDRERLDLIEVKGYRTKVVWEKDYRKNPKKSIKECLEVIDEIL